MRTEERGGLRTERGIEEGGRGGRNWVEGKKVLFMKAQRGGWL